jgi:hypothetical protein
LSDTIAKLRELREPFPAHQISYLPKGGVKLAYVGHAALTDRLLDTDPAWSWEPLAHDADGLPKLDDIGGLWIKLTVCGVTRLGYGDAGDKKGTNAMKERIGDALRNAAMRFGAALDLWHKGELHGPDDDALLVPALKASIAQAKTRTGVIAAVLDDMPALSEEDSLYFRELAENVEDLFANKGAAVAFDRIKAVRLDSEQSIHLWSHLGSKVRAALKIEGGLRNGSA